MKINVCIQHFLSKDSQKKYDLPGGWIPGSARGTVKKRTESFSKCLWSLVHLGKENDYSLLDIRTNQFNRLQNVYNIYIST